jgi:hypothetical protein
MRVRYFIEFALEQDAQGSFFHRAAGVWARGEGPWALDVYYTPAYEERQWKADLHLSGFMERGDEHFPDDLLERWRRSLSSYQGDCSPIYETEARNAEEVALQILEKLTAKRPLPNPPFVPA